MVSVDPDSRGVEGNVGGGLIRIEGGERGRGCDGFCWAGGREIRLVTPEEKEGT